jgi:uncharacterized DUF497 family protein
MVMPSVSLKELTCSYNCSYSIFMEFEWDEAKRRGNLAKHGVDFVDAQALFDGRPVLTVLSPRSGEERSATTGEIDGRFYTVISTQRGKRIRIISARRARDGEQRAYRSLYGT